MTPAGIGEKDATPNTFAPRGSRSLEALENVGMDSSSAHGPGPPAADLPVELSSFIGREQEIAEVKRRLGDTRLLTLTGPGGCGKTRLAMAVAFEMVGGFENGVWWAGLALLSDPTLVVQEVSQVLGVREAPGRSPTEALAQHLEHKKTLLVLDNCEHLIDACAELVDTLLRSCPKLHILATSREALGVGGEIAWLVPPLALPDPGDRAPVEELGRYEGIRLFRERARSVAPTFELGEGNAPAVARLCRQLEGVPLAIELAAARTRVLSVEQILKRLEDSLKLRAGSDRTAPERQRTLRGTLDWSYDLLSEAERLLFARLSVFAGGWTLEAAEAVGAGDDIEEEDVLDLLSKLVDKSFVVVEGTSGENGLGYRMLEPVRQYGYERLEGSGEAEAVRRRHAEYYLALVEEAEPELREQGAWLESLEAEHANRRAALGWALDPVEDAQEPAGAERAELGLRLAAALAQGRFWNAYGPSEGRRWLERGLA
jgi:predicted ATPase